VGAGLRVAFLGNATWSVPSLEALAQSGHDLVRVITRVPRPARRGRALVPTPVAAAGRIASLPVAEVETVKSGPGLEALRGARPEAVVVVAYGEILPSEVLAIPSVAPVNLHFSLLPELRGPAPVQHALLDGLVSTGVTTLVMDQGVDTGPILLQAAEQIDQEDDAGSLGARLAAVGARLLVDTLDRLAAGDLEPRPQDEARATYAPKIEEREIDWTEEAGRIANLVRALAPHPGAVTRWRGRPLRILAARQQAGSGRPGTVVRSDERGFAVAAGEGTVSPLEVLPSGRRRMSAEEFVRGYRPALGESVG
jgi:methionyl-tRNA formyltransferase